MSGRGRPVAVLIAMLFALAPIAASQSPAAPARHQVTGMVLSVDPAQRTFVASIDRIAGYMEAMTMPFTVARASDLTSVAPGAVVEFTLVVTRTASSVEGLRVVRHQNLEQDPLAARRLSLLRQMSVGSSKPVAIGAAVPDFELIDQSSRKVSLSALRGKVVGINFMYATCQLPDFCLRLVNHFSVIQQRLAQALGRDLVLLTITFDPLRDTPEALAEYSRQWHPSADWRFLTGDPKAITRVLDSFGVSAFANDGLMDHSLHTVFIDRAGRLAAHVEGNKYSSDQIVALARAIIDGQRPSTADPSIPDRLARVQRALFSGTGDPRDAIRELQTILAVAPQSPEAHVLLGIAYRGLGTQEFIAEAVAEFRQALEIDPNQPPARLYLAYCYRDLGRLDRARDELQTAMAQAPGNPQILALLGDTERQLRNPARALELEQQALKADPTFGQARYYAALALRDLGRRDESTRELEQIVRAGVTEADVYLALGASYLDANRVREAVETLSRGVQLASSRADLRIQLARALRMSGALADAEAQLARAATGRAGSRLDQQQIDVDLAIEQGLLALAKGQLVAAVRALQRALALESDNGPANRGLAQVYVRQGSWTLAAKHAALAEKAGFPLSDADRALIRQKNGGGRRDPA